MVVREPLGAFLEGFGGVAAPVVEIKTAHLPKNGPLFQLEESNSVSNS